MRKLLVASLLFLSFHSAFAQKAATPTQREWNIYYQYIEKISGVSTEDKEVFNRAYEKAAAEMGVSKEELAAIEAKVFEYGPTPEEEKIFDDLLDRLKALGDNASREQEEAVYVRVASDYGLSLARILDISGRW